MYLLLTLAAIFILWLLKNPIRSFAGWILARFTSMPVVFNRQIVSSFIKVVILNWYTFLMILVLWILLFKTEVGKDIINSYLSNLKRLEPGLKFLSLLFLFLTTFSMSMAIWLLPFFTYSSATMENILKDAQQFYISTKLLAFFAMLPFLVVTNAFLAFFNPLADWGIGGTFLINFLSFLLFFFLIYLFETVQTRRLPRIFSSLSDSIKKRIRNPYVFILLRILFWIAIIILVFFKINLQLEHQGLIVAIFIFTCSIVVFRLLFYTPGTGVEDPEALVRQMLSLQNRKASKVLYLSLFFLLIADIFYYYLIPSLEATNPLYLLLIIFSLFIIYLDFWRNIFRNKKGLLRITALLANVLFLILPFIPDNDQFRIPFQETDNPSEDTFSLEKSLKARIDHINKSDSLSSKYIICAMGGGSRAGYITAAVLQKLDSIDPKLWERTICYSTISGGSVGTYNYIKGKQYRVINDRHYLEYIYQKNYNSSGVFGLLVGDALETFFGKIITTPKEWITHNKPPLGYFDRNYRIRQEYDYILDQALRGDTQVRYGKRTFYPYYQPDLTRDLFKEYFQTRKDSIPIHLINTFEINSGRRAVLSPFPTADTNFFINAILPLQDKTFQPDTLHHDIYYREAVNLSELFPLISAASHLGANRDAQFVDGGYYENYGLATALDVYFYLNKIMESEISQVKIILIKNSKQEAEISGSQVQLLAPLVGAVNSPFTGHANHILEETKRVMDSAHLFVITFDAEIKKVPLTRALTASQIDSMNTFINGLKDYPKLKPFLKIK